jgi:hypothetical protein
MAQTVKIGVVNGQVREYAPEEGTTIAQAIDMAELSIDGYEVVVNGVKTSSLTAPVANGDTILLAKQIKGN